MTSIAIPYALSKVLAECNKKKDSDKDSDTCLGWFISGILIILVWISYFSPLVVGAYYYVLQYHITTLLIRYDADSYTLFNSVMFCMIRTFNTLFLVINFCAGTSEKVLSSA
jgi:hypothetical protein